ncbi:hypothetical protein BDN70DRAFT_89451 [Pholiota conissans]|uniref:Uncharacterized protein n=1 Tax=Pholiota conissans TaxID=109636 RepID=A0A9P5YZB7_9AGAR|nr:hypothetical protein BDN70DRAFT_89451 [Pholiota conissans]
MRWLCTKFTVAMIHRHRHIHRTHPGSLDDNDKRTHRYILQSHPPTVIFPIFTPPNPNSRVRVLLLQTRWPLYRHRHRLRAIRSSPTRRPLLVVAPPPFAARERRNPTRLALTPRNGRSRECRTPVVAHPQCTVPRHRRARRQPECCPRRSDGAAWAKNTSSSATATAPSEAGPCAEEAADDDPGGVVGACFGYGSDGAGHGSG